MPILNYTTTIPVEKSMGEVIGALTRRGVTRISTVFSDDGAPGGIAFIENETPRSNTMQFFDELPAGRAVRDEPVDWAQAKSDLMENPGKWGLMAENISSSTPGQLRAGKNQFFRGAELDHFEFRVRKPESPTTPYGPRRTDLYGRYTVAAKNEVYDA